MTTNKRPPDIFRARHLIEGVLGAPCGSRHAPPQASTIAAARAVAAARGRGDDEHLIAYLAGLSEITAPAADEHLSGVQRMAGLLEHPEHGGTARAVLAGFVRRHGCGAAVRAARTALGLPPLPEPTPVLPPPALSPPPQSGLRRLVAALAIVGAAVRRQPRLASAAVIGGLASGLFVVGLFILLPPVVTGAADAASSGRYESRPLAIAALVAITVYTLRAGGIVAYRVGTRGMLNRLRTGDRRAVVDRLLHLPADWYRRQVAGDLAGAVGTDVDAAWQPIAHLALAVATTASCVAALVMLALVDGWLLAVGLALLVSAAAGNLLYLRWIGPHVARAAALRVEVLSLTHCGPSFPARSAELRRAMTKVGTIRAVFDPALAALPVVAGLAAVATLVARSGGAGSTTDLVGAAVLFAVIATPIRKVGRLLTDVPAASAAAERVEQIRAARGDLAYGAASAPTGSAGLRLSDVHFEFTPGEPVLQGLTLEIPAGRLVALVGPSGAGKTTLAMLAARRVDPTGGAVLLAGTNIGTLSRDALDRAVSYVPVRPRYGADTVRAILRAHLAAATDAEMLRTLQLVLPHKLFADLDAGLDTRIRPPGGARSRRLGRHLALAGAVLGRPRLLVLDSGPDDPEFDPLTLKAVRSVGNDLTVLAVTSRPDLIRAADDVLFLGDGSTAQLERHAHLMRTNHAYQTLLAGYEYAATVPSTEPPPQEPIRPGGLRHGPIERLQTASEFVSTDGYPIMEVESR